MSTDGIEHGKPIRLSVVIPCYNAAATIGKQLDALASQRWSEPWEVVVADNGSTDQSMAIVKQYEGRIPNLRIVDASDRRGQPYALNVGVCTAKGDLLLLADTDDEVGSSWLPAMGKALLRHELVAARLDTKKLNTPFIHSIRGDLQRDGLIEYVYPPYLPHAAGASLGFRRSVYEKVDGFSEAFPALHDTDFVWKAQRGATELHFVLNAVVHYRFRDSIIGNFKQAKLYGEYNVKLYKKYRALDMPKIPWKSGVKNWIRLTKQVRRIRDSKQRGRWMRHLGWLIGRLKGCIKYRVLAL